MIWLLACQPAEVPLAELKEDERNLAVMAAMDEDPDPALCELASGVVKERCERMTERPHLHEKVRRNPADSTLWRLPEKTLTLEVCEAHEAPKWVRDCYFEQAEAEPALTRALTLCRGAEGTSGQCASHVLMSRWEEPPEQVIPAIEAADLGDAEHPVVALYRAGHAERTDAGPVEFLNSSRALDGRELREAPPAWRRARPGEDWTRIPIHSSRADVRPTVQDPAVDRVLAELFAAYLTEPDPDALAAHAHHSEAVVRWSVALLLAEVAPHHPALEALAGDDDPRVAARAQAI